MTCFAELLWTLLGIVFSSRRLTPKVTILFDGDTGSGKFRGVPILYNFNSKAMGFTKGLFLACGLELKSGERYRLEACAGREVDMFIGNKPYLGRTLNDVNHQYRAPNPTVTLVEEPPAEQPATT